jgi:hypothetical protein
VTTTTSVPAAAAASSAEALAERAGADHDVGAAEGVELMGLEPTTS